MKSFSYVEITLNDINDNPPYLAYASTNKPLIINEGESSGSVELYAIDVDTPKYGPPFTFILDNYTDLFGIQQINCQNCKGDRAKYQLFNKKPLNRDIQKSYILPYTLSDNGGVARTGRFELIVGDINNNPQTDGAKQVELVLFENNLQPDSFLGTLYVNDKDDWDLGFKVSSACQQNVNLFDVRGLYIYGPKVNSNFPQSVMNIQCSVEDLILNSKATAKVDFQVDNVYFKDTLDLVGIRLLGITAERFISKRDYSVEKSVLDNFLNRLISALQLSTPLDPSGDYINIVTVRNYEADKSKLLSDEIPNFVAQQFGTDIYFYAKKNGKLISSRKAYNLLFNNLNQFQSRAYSSVVLLFDTCATVGSDYCPVNTYCKQMYLISRKTITVDGNATAIVSMDNTLNPQCFCEQPNKAKTCFNGGVLYTSSGGSDFYCECPAGYEGPRCEMLSLTFTYLASSPSHSYALFPKSIPLCTPVRIEFEFSTDRYKGLLLFNGPSNRDSLYFIAVEIFNRSLLVHIGYSNVTFTNVNVSDKSWHKVEIEMSLDAVQVNLDECNSQNLILANYDKMVADQQASDTVTLSLGGIPPSISTNHYYYSVLNVFEYEGCIRNLRINGELRDLKLTANNFNLAQNSAECDCKYLKDCEVVNASIIKNYEFPWWIILIIIAVLLMLGKFDNLTLYALLSNRNILRNRKKISAIRKEKAV